MFYAVGYTNNGANEKGLGPFTTKDEAMKAGRSEAGITKGFSFSGVVDDSGDYVYHNSRACNSTNSVVANAMRARNGNVVMNTMGDGMSDGQSRIDEAIDEMKYVMGFRLRQTAEDASKKAYAEVAGIAKALIAQLQSIKREMERARRIADGQML